MKYLNLKSSQELASKLNLEVSRKLESKVKCTVHASKPYELIRNTHMSRPRYLEFRILRRHFQGEWIPLLSSAVRLARFSWKQVSSLNKVFLLKKVSFFKKAHLVQRTSSRLESE